MDGRIDFTSALYLGLSHPTSALQPLPALTSGKPAKLHVPAAFGRVARTLASLLGYGQGILMPSTLHVFTDLFQVLARDPIRIYVDAGAYPIARRAVQLASVRGAHVRIVPHFHPGAAARAIRDDAADGTRPVLLADGFCPDCGRAVPLPEYLQAVAPFGGHVVLDDTQALGIWGELPSATQPYGTGGGGSARLHGIASPALIAGSSLAKAFGAPVAVLCGYAEVIRRVKLYGTMWEHASQPSAVAVAAAGQALRDNRERGDSLRKRLAHQVTLFQQGVRALGLEPARTLFPMQRLPIPGHVDPIAVHRRLRSSGIDTALIRKPNGTTASLLFIINASHRPEEIARAVRALERSM